GALAFRQPVLVLRYARRPDLHSFPTRRSSDLKDWKSETKSIILIVVSVLVFRSVFFEPFKIPTGSMIPTLMIGDFILVNKFSYGDRKITRLNSSHVKISYAVCSS